MANTLNISALARRTGVAPDTLRKWEQRYGILTPDRTSGGQRRYSERDVARVEWLRDRLAEGYRIGEAASILGGSATPSVDPADLPDRLLAAVEATDADTVAALLDHTFAVLPTERALLEVVNPVLYRVGEAWASGTLTVAQEHLVSAKVRARLESLLSGRHGGVRGTAVLACAPGERHDLGLLVLAVLLQADGWKIEYLGADTPVDQAVALAGAIEAQILCVSAARPDTADALVSGLEAVERSGAPRIVVGGAAVTPALARSIGAEYVNGADMHAAVGRLRAFAAA